MKKYVMVLLSLLIINSCHKDMLVNQDIRSEQIKTLTERLIYEKEEETRIKALDDLTRMDIKVRYSALNELINAVESNPELFPSEKAVENPPLLNEIITARLNYHKDKNQKEYVKERMMYLQMLNRFLRLSMQYKWYYEMAKILYKKYLYGALWSQESLAVYKNKSAATEFEHAKNAAIANLHLLLKIAQEERTKNFVRQRLVEMGEM